MKLIGLTMIMLFLSSCSTTSIEYVPICAPVKGYTSAQETKAGNELKACGDKCQETEEMLKDGYVLRQASKECTKK